jgi:hypothetical protein
MDSIIRGKTPEILNNNVILGYIQVNEGIDGQEFDKILTLVNEFQILFFKVLMIIDFHFYLFQIFFVLQKFANYFYGHYFILKKQFIDDKIFSTLGI